MEVKKQLYKSKEVAKLSHYVSGNIYYTVELEGGTYQFPMSTVEEVKLSDMELKTRTGVKEKVDIEISYNYEDTEQLYVYDKYANNDKGDYVEATCKMLSSDLGTTPFYAEMKGSDLNRWIAMAIKSGEFIKIS